MFLIQTYWKNLVQNQYLFGAAVFISLFFLWSAYLFNAAVFWGSVATAIAIAFCFSRSFRWFFFPAVLCFHYNLLGAWGIRFRFEGFTILPVDWLALAKFEWAGVCMFEMSSHKIFERPE